jgi:hypothetical protein
VTGTPNRTPSRREILVPADGGIERIRLTDCTVMPSPNSDG